jgi:hypothetical protein
VRKPCFLLRFISPIIQRRPGAARERSGRAQTPVPHNSDAPFPFCEFAPAYEPGIWHSPGIAPPPQGVRTERGTELHCWRRTWTGWTTPFHASGATAITCTSSAPVVTGHPHRLSQATKSDQRLSHSVRSPNSRFFAF